MPGESDFDRIFIWLETQEKVESEIFFSTLKSAYDLSDAYHFELLIDASGQATRADRSTPVEPELARELQRCTTRFIPTEISTNEPLLRLLKIVSTENMRVVSFPIRTSQKTTSIFVVTLSIHDQTWQKVRLKLYRELPTLLASYLHQSTKQWNDQGQDTQENRSLLTPREREVLSWAAAGKSYWEISRILGITERTIRYHMANVRNALDAVSNKQVIATAVRLGLIDGVHPDTPLFTGLQDREFSVIRREV